MLGYVTSNERLVCGGDAGPPGVRGHLDSSAKLVVHGLLFVPSWSAMVAFNRRIAVSRTSRMRR
jgi:hypothetical protein